MLSQEGKNAFEQLVALKDITRTTGTKTTHAQSIILRKLSPSDLTEIAVIFRRCEEKGLTVCDPAQLEESASV